MNEKVVHQVLDVLLGESRRSLYDLTADGRRRDGSLRPTPICARETASKIKRVFDEGRLGRFVEYHRNRLGAEGEQPPLPDPSRDAPHQEFLKGLVYGVRLELARLSPFPTVKRSPYRPEDPASHLHEVRTDDVTHIEWRLADELNDGWHLVRQHLETGHQDAMVALTRVKRSRGLYCQKLSETEDGYRKEAPIDLVADPEWPPHDSRLILSELDNVEHSPSGQEYCVHEETDPLVWLTREKPYSGLEIEKQQSR